jgi:hypothetical protein
VTAPKVPDVLADYTTGQHVTWHTNAGPAGAVIHERETSSR